MTEPNRTTVKIFLVATFFAIGFFVSSAQRVEAQTCPPINDQGLGCAPFSGAQSGFSSCEGCSHTNCCVAQGLVQTHCNWGCGGGGSPGGPSGCTVVPPSIAVYVPANNQVFTTNTVTPSYFVYNWGEGCPTVSSGPAIYLYENCNAAAPPPIGTIGYKLVSYGSAPITNLNWGTTYCLVMLVRNNATTGYTFTSPIPFHIRAAPQITGETFDAASTSKCNATHGSGRSTFTNTNNPVTYQFNISHQDNDFGAGTNLLREARVIIVPTSVMNTAYANAPVLEPLARNYVGFRAQGMNTAMPQYSAINSTVAPFFGSSTTSGDLSNTAGTATLLGANTTSSVSAVNNATQQVKFNMRFENTLANGLYNVYILAASDSGGTLISQDTVTNGLLRYRKIETWRIDMSPPVVSITGPTILSATTFRLRWNANETTTGNNGLQNIRGYCYSTDGNPLAFTDTTYGQAINAPASPLSFPDPGNCFITAANLTNHDYSAPSTASLNFQIYAEDTLCNSATGSAALASPNPWIITNGGRASAGGGYQKFSPANTANLATYITGLGDDAYLSTFSALSGNDQHTSTRQSKNSFFAKDYTDLSLKPSAIAGTTKWYDFARELVASRATIKPLTTQTAAAKLTTAFAVPVQAAAQVVEVTPTGGTLTIGAAAGGGQCDTDLVVFVRGNLNINPNLLNLGNARCIYIVSGNITVNSGVVSTVSGASRYDTIEGMFVTDGTFTTNLDQPSAAASDALLIRGGVAAAAVSLKRNLGRTNNGVQPSEAVIYDPLLLTKFRTLLAVTEYSLREF